MELALDLRQGDAGPLDASGHRNAIRAVHIRRAEGPYRRGRAMAFDGRHSRIAVLPSASWAQMDGVRVTTRIWIDALAGRQTVIEAYLSFALFIDADGSLGATVYSGSDWGGVRSTPGVVPVRRWVEIRYNYDGIDTSEIAVDGAVRAQEFSSFGPVRGVQWPYGVSVGAWPDAEKRLFHGRMDALRVWRGSR
jgi:hypothetical protein